MVWLRVSLWKTEIMTQSGNFNSEQWNYYLVLLFFNGNTSFSGQNWILEHTQLGIFVTF